MSDTYADVDGGLLFWHPVDDAVIDESYLPAGLVAAGSSGDTRLRVRNASGDYTATGVSVAVGGSADPGAADVSGEYLLSADGGTFTATLLVGDLAAQQISDAFTLRRVTPGDAAQGPGGFTLTATAGGWVPAVASPTTASAAADVFDPDAAQDPVGDVQGAA